MRPIRKLTVVAAAAGLMLAVVVAPAAAAPAVAAHPGSDTGRLVPLGSLGGGESWAEHMNQRGDIAGGSIDATTRWQAAIWWHGRRAATSLGVGSASPSAINERGDVVGSMHFQDGVLFLWRRGKVTYLRFGAANHPSATGINDRDQIVGSVWYPDDTHRAFSWQHGHLTLLPVPRGMDSVAVDVNERGQIVGAIAPRGGGTERAVLWQHGRLIRLGSLRGSADSKAVAINDRGQVIGSSAGRPFRWQHGRMTDLLAGTGATSGSVYALSNSGLMTGSVSVRPGESRPVLWKGGRMIDVGLPGYTGLGTAINDRGDVAGMTWAPAGGSHAVPFRWHQGRVTLFPKPAAEISIRVIGIDRHGTIGVTAETLSPGLVLMRSA
jgi:uncharacterized membrane protein